MLRSTEFPESYDFDLASLPQHKLGAWCDYVLGVAQALTHEGFALRGANLLVHGEVPIGAGLSSSAALEVASALALLSLSDGELPLKSVAKLCQKAENEFVGAHVGIMDQFVSCFGKQGHSLLLDCRSLDFELVPVPENVKLVICNTMVKHQLWAESITAAARSASGGYKSCPSSIRQSRRCATSHFLNCSSMPASFPQSSTSAACM